MEIPTDVVQQMQSMRAECAMSGLSRGEVGKRTNTVLAVLIDNDTKMPWCKAEGIDKLSAMRAAIELGKKTPRPLPAGHDLSADTIELRKEVAELRAQLAAKQPAATDQPKNKRGRKPVLVPAGADDEGGVEETDAGSGLSIDQAKSLLKR